MEYFILEIMVDMTWLNWDLLKEETKS